MTAPVRTLLIDNYDSYTYNLFQLLCEVNGEPPIVRFNNELTLSAVQKLLEEGRVQNIVISPGPGTPERPTDVGVCLGHQALAHVHGGAVVSAPEPVHGRISELRHNGHPLFSNLPSGPGAGLDVVRYHSLLVDAATLPDCLQPVAWTCGKDHAVGLAQDNEAGLQRTRPHFGVQFHPESVATKFGAALLSNFRDLTCDVLGLPSYTREDRSSKQMSAPPGRAFAPRPWPDDAATLTQQGRVYAADAGFPGAVAATAAAIGSLSDASIAGPASAACAASKAVLEEATGVSEATAARLHAYGSLQLAWRKLPGALEAAGGSQAIFEGLLAYQANSFWLDSAAAPDRGRFSFMGAAGGPLWRRLSFNLAPASEGASDLPPAVLGAGAGVAGAAHVGQPAGAPTGTAAHPPSSHAQDNLGSSGADSNSGSSASRRTLDQDSGSGGSKARPPGYLTIQGPGAQSSILRTHLFDFLEGFLAAHHLPPSAEAAAQLPFNFWGGLVGYLGYELKAECGGACAHASPHPDAALFFADRLLAVDHLTQDVFILALHDAAEAAAPGSGRQRQAAWLANTQRRVEQLIARRADASHVAPHDPVTRSACACAGSTAGYPSHTSPAGDPAGSEHPGSGGVDVPLPSWGLAASGTPAGDRDRAAATRGTGAGGPAGGSRGLSGVPTGVEVRAGTANTPGFLGEGVRDARASRPAAGSGRLGASIVGGVPSTEACRHSGHTTATPSSWDPQQTQGHTDAGTSRPGSGTTPTSGGCSASRVEVAGAGARSGPRDGLANCASPARGKQRILHASADGSAHELRPMHTGSGQVGGARASGAAGRRAVRPLPHSGTSHMAGIREALPAEGMPAPAPAPHPPFRLCHPRQQYLANAEACQRALHAGESYEVCLTTALVRPQPPDPAVLYRNLRRLNPAPYGAWCHFGGAAPTLCCSSPERFLRGDRGGLLEARPIKGTAPRHPGDPEADAAEAAALAASEKDRAENLMIVDLLRNDLGRVCEAGSVHVPGLMEIESFATVHQLVSTVRGLKRADISPVECIRAAFPGGSMTGAPKVRTMQILDQLEGRARGVYSGCIGYLSINDTFDFNIVIRTAVIDQGASRSGHAGGSAAAVGGAGASTPPLSGKQEGAASTPVRDRAQWAAAPAPAASGSISIGAGGAIVVQSDPRLEYNEMRLKARALLHAVGMSDRTGGGDAAVDEDRTLVHGEQARGLYEPCGTANCMCNCGQL